MIELLLVADGLLTAGELDRAERIYQQVAEADPRNAIAVVGLAHVAHARGLSEAAADFLWRALEIDPEDQAAQRLAMVWADARAAASPESAPEPATAADTEPAATAPEPPPERVVEPAASSVPDPTSQPAVTDVPAVADSGMAPVRSDTQPARRPSLLATIRAFLGLPD